jgi:hypothetical protein
VFWSSCNSIGTAGLEDVRGKDPWCYGGQVKRQHINGILGDLESSLEGSSFGTSLGPAWFGEFGAGSQEYLESQVT